MHWDSIKKIESSDLNVFKYVFHNKTAVAESVLYKYPTFEERTVICCSTQSGCPIGCRFCGAGDYFVRSLNADEIISQPVYLLESNKIDASKIGRLQIMFMSMGEPMLNFINLKKALIGLYEKYPKAALLISTSAPTVDFEELTQLSIDIPTIGLQFSVHESNDVERNKLIPFKGKYSLKDISDIGQKWSFKTGRRPFFNYCVHENNNKDANIQELLDLFSPDIWESTISVICERDENIAAANDRQKELAKSFMNKMIDAGYSTRMFDPAGQDDIGGGCGQLWFVQSWMKNNSNKIKKSIGYNKPIVHTPVAL